MTTPNETDVPEIKVYRSRRRLYDAEVNSDRESVPSPVQLEFAGKYSSDVSKEKIFSIIRNYSMLSMGAGLIPVPVIDLAAIAGLQVKMIQTLAMYYGIPFSEVKVKSTIAGLAGSVLPSSFATGTLTSMIKAVPIIGTLIGSLTLPLTAGACTYAIGKIFVQHFETGGTLLDFEANKVRSYFIAEFHKAKEEVRPYTTKMKQ